MKNRLSEERQLFDPNLFPKGDNRAITAIHKRYANLFTGWALKNFSLKKDEAGEVFDKAVMVFRQKVWNGELIDYKGIAESTLLFALAKNIIRDRYKKSMIYAERYVPLEDEHYETVAQSLENMPYEEVNALFSAAESEREREVRKAFYSLGEKCQQILLMRIVYGYSIEEIAKEMEFKNTDSTKTQKNKCFNKLKSFLGLR